MNLSLAGVGSTLPAASIARTSNVCLPFLRRLSFFGEEQGFHRFLSSLHSKVEWRFEELNLNLTLVFSVLSGARLVIEVSGGAPASTATPGGATETGMNV